MNRVGLELVKFWLNGEGQSPDPQRLLEQFLIQYRWHTDLARKEGISSRLAESVQEYNKNFSNTINTWKNKLEKSIADCQTRDDRNAIYEKLSKEFREQFRKTQPGETENSRGIWLTKLQQVCPTLTKELQTNIDDYITRLLVPSEPHFSIRSTRDGLDALQHELHNYQRNLQEEIANFGGMRRLEDLEKKWRDAEQILQDIEQKAALPFLSNKNSQAQTEAKRVLREVCELIKHNFQLGVLQESLQIVDILQKHVQSRDSQVAAFNSLVENLKSGYEKQEKDLQQLNFDEMSGEAIFDNEDIERCLQTMLPKDDLRRQFVLATSSITEPTGRGQSLASFIDRERTTQQQLQKEIDVNVDSLFASRGISIVNSVIKRFMQNYSLAARSTRLAQIMQEAQPLLNLNLSDPYFCDDPAKSSKLVGFKDTDELEVRQFKILLGQDLGVHSSVFKSTQADDEILFVNEYAGFPIRLISSLERMRNPYLREQNSSTSFLHNDYRASFPDIIPPDAKKMEELEDIFYPCLALMLLEKNQENQKLEFQYYDALQDCYYTACLSTEWNQALEELANHRGMTETLKKLLDGAIANITHQPVLWQNNYLPKLRQFVEQVKNLSPDNSNYPYKTAVYTPPGGNDPTTKEGIINRFWRKMEECFKTFQNQTLALNGSIKSKKDNSEEVVVVNFHVDVEDNRAQRRAELERLKQDLSDDIITQNEYENLRKEILSKYPL
ncbi:hypothetical protein F7734_52735 [Scytonema sp. UIC 10036]|uniref:hypothetical protein n=1 Tax=Scytonema sp. UIC 10036 TaxID=2304196 RepID=UPI0012DAF399|nr:hypothetical protein [Scytonema sp. UIC 10036]